MGGGEGDDVLEAELVPVMLPGSTGSAPDADAERERGLSPLREEELAGAEDWANLVPEDSPLPTPVPPRDRAPSGPGRPFDARRSWHGAKRKITQGVLVSQNFSRDLKQRMERAKAAVDDGTPMARTESQSSRSATDVDEEGVPAVVKAAAEGEAMELRRLISLMPTKPDTTLAEELDSTRIVECNGHNVNEPNEDGIDLKHWNDHGQNAIIKATRNNHGRCVEILLDAGASSTVTDSKYRSAWYYACASRRASSG